VKHLFGLACRTGIALFLILGAEFATIQGANPASRLRALRAPSDSGTLDSVVQNDARRIAAVQRLTDQAELARIAQQDANADVRRAAVQRLADQVVLADIAQSDVVPGVRAAAVERLNDQTLIAGIVQKDADPSVRAAAVARLRDQALLSGIAQKDGPLCERLNATAMLRDEESLHSLAARGGHVAGAAKLALFLLNPHVRQRMPDARLRFECETDAQSYGPGGVVNVKGERIRTRITHQGKEIVAAYDTSEFPNSLMFNPGFIPASIAWDRLIVNVVGSRVFSEKDVSPLIQSDDPAVRRVAVGKLSDEALLYAIAVNDADAGVRKIAVWKLFNHALLTRIAVEDKDASVRQAAEGVIV
jgi:hypothetical protein